MKNILNIDNGIPTLLSNVDDGTNTLYINDELVPSSEWTGTGYYTFTSGGLTFTIRKIRDTSGNIMLQLIEQSGGTSYRLIKAVSTDDKYYSIDDPAETDLADGDYVPFYDTSAGAKKKSLWSNIVDKIKTALGIESSGNTFLKKDGTWGTPIRGTFFGTCDTAADQAVKVITLSDSTGFSLLPGVVIGVKYTYTNTKLICSLNVNNTGQIRVAIGEQTPLMHNQEYMFGKAGYTTYYMYDGQYWNFLNHNGNIKDGTTYAFATGDSNGQIKVTPSGGTAQNVSVKGLDSAAYLAADTNGTANTVVKRSGYGYINAGNSSTENPTSYTSYPVFQDSDGWFRKSTKANFLSWLGFTSTKKKYSTGVLQIGGSTYATHNVTLSGSNVANLGIVVGFAITSSPNVCMMQVYLASNTSLVIRVRNTANATDSYNVDVYYL